MSRRQESLQENVSKRQADIRSYVDTVTSSERHDAIAAETDRLRRDRKTTRRHDQPHRDEVSVALLTQNVRGLASRSSGMDDWFTAFRQHEDGRQIDIAMIQETLVSESSIATVTSAHARHWGYHEDHVPWPLSHWGPAAGRSGGVAILINPHAAVSSVSPFRRDLWSANFVAVAVTLDGGSFLVMNVYAPSTRTDRERFYGSLLELEIPHGLRLLLGGDFNSTQDPRVDRSNDGSRRSHVSRALERLIARWSILDTASDAIQRAVTPDAVRRFAADHHTYVYSLADGTEASSRLDRWYIGARDYDWVRRVQVVVPGPSTDHNGVLLLVNNPTCRRRRKPRPRAYPPPHYSAAASGAVVEDLLVQFANRLESDSVTNDGGEARALHWAREWDALKAEVKAAYMRTRRECKTKITKAHRQRLRRLSSALRKTEADPPDLAQQLRADVAARRLVAQQRRRTALLSFHSMRQPSTRRLFQRISTKYQDPTVYSLVADDGRVYTQSELLPTVMANGWRKVIDPTLPLINWSSAKAASFRAQPSTGLECLAEPTSADALRSALRRCKRGKSAGPDGLGNDWYRDHADLLLPILLRLFNMWKMVSVVPQSFKEALIVGLKKTRTAKRPTDFRPIALLNSDYKLFTRLLATLLRDRLPLLVHLWQCGFVPGRSIHTVLDLYHAVKELVRLGRLPETAIMLMLDFAKAYDALRRDYLLWTLRNKGFPELFVRLIDVLHTNTSYQFVVNGFMSSAVPVTSGIRQGCPLAPLLFVIALSPLYDAIDKSAAIRGLQLDSESTRLQVKVAGYADDTALYLRDSCDIRAAHELLSRFGELSGLKLNVAKSVGLRLSGTEPTVERTPSEFAILSPTDTTRYLGVRVGNPDTHDENWSLCLRATTMRLTLAVAKTHTVLQRVQIARAIIIPKVLFLARHVWPTRATIDNLCGMVRKFIWGSRQGRKNRAWVSETVAELPQHHGGLAVPNLRTELFAMAGKTVGDWAAGQDRHARLLRDLLRDPRGALQQYITPRHMTPTAPVRYQSTLWKTGVEVLQHEHGTRPDGGVHRQMSIAATDIRACLRRAKWVSEELVVLTTGALRAQANHLARLQREAFGRPHPAWLQHLDASTPGALWEDGSTRLNVKDMSYTGGTTQLADLVAWTWRSVDQIVFRPIRRHYPLSNTHARQFSRLCCALLVTYPFLLRRPTTPGEIVPYGTAECETWSTHDADDGVVLSYNGSVLENAHLLTSMAAVDRQAREAVRRPLLSLPALPQLTRLVQPWSGVERWKPSRKRYRRLVHQARRTRGEAARDRSRANGGDLDPRIHLPLDSLTWADLHRLQPATSMEIQTLYRIKSNAMPRWRDPSQALECVHPDCAVPNPSRVTHWYWECSAARSLWAKMLQPWSVLFACSERDLSERVFCVQLDQLPPHAARLLIKADRASTSRDRHVDALLGVLQHAWTGMVTATLHSLWVWRIGLLLQREDWETGGAARSCRRVMYRIETLGTTFNYSAVEEEANSQRSLLAAVIGMWSPGELTVQLAPPVHRGEFVCFFDGGSRGNPGPGGSGTVIIRVDRTARAAEVVWFAMMSYASKHTTNNQAEYYGLVHGLRHAARHRLAPLHVVGDSALVLHQVEHHKPPKAPHLRAIYIQARRLATDITVSSWRHHLRQYNKMADCAANLAMDTRLSLQAPAALRMTELGSLQPFLSNDISHWFEMMPTHGRSGY